MEVAVLMSTYNGEKYLKKQIESILAQQGDFQIDLWVRDDGSTDLTKVILQKYTEQGKLHWYTGKKIYAAKSFIDLIIKVKNYDFYAFADQDDYWFSDKLTIGVYALSQKDFSLPALYFANAELVGSNFESLGRNVYKSMPRTDFETICCAGGYLGCTMIFNNSLAKLIQEKSIPEKIVMHDFYIAEVCACFDGNIIFDSNPNMKYRQHGNNVVGQTVRKHGSLT